MKVFPFALGRGLEILRYTAIQICHSLAWLPDLILNSDEVIPNIDLWMTDLLVGYLFIFKIEKQNG